MIIDLRESMISKPLLQFPTLVVRLRPKPKLGTPYNVIGGYMPIQ
jgi:hypothetical protein